jgi:DHA1 family bicyclomycin/chloramphenicol resistance-like MFS transporter
MQITPQRPTPPLWLLVLITLSGTMAMHMFVPALPHAAKDLGASSGAMQMTISLYILGLALGQLFYGPLSDTFGRRPMLMTGLALYAMGGLAAALAPGLHVLVAARLFQALGGCAGLALGRAIVRDTAQPEKAVRQLALLNLMMMIGPGLAPMIGGAISSALGWRTVFWVLTAIGALTLVFTLRLLPETGRPRGGFSLGKLLLDYRSLLGSPKFLGFALGGGCTTTSIYAFIATAPFIFTMQLHRPVHDVGIYLGIMIFGMALGNAITGRLIHKIPMERMLLSGNALSIISASALLVIVLLGYLSVGTALCLMFLFACGAGISSPAALGKSLGVDPSRVGSAAGLYGFTQMAVGAACTSFAALGDNPALTAATVLTVAAVLGQIGFWVALARERAERTGVIGAV